MKDKEKQFKERIDCGIAYCEDIPNNQIEEMAKYIETAKQHIWVGVRKRQEDEDYLWHSRAIAEYLEEQGYRKIPKDARVFIPTDEQYVMLSREEYEKGKQDYNYQIHRALVAEGRVDKASKETVEKVLNELVGHTFEDEGWTWTVSKEDIQWLVDKYKVEIKE